MNILVKDTANSTKLETINRDVKNSQIITKNNEVKNIGIDVIIKSDELKEKENNNHWNETGKVLSSSVAQTTTMLGGNKELSNEIEKLGKDVDKTVYANTKGTIDAVYQTVTTNRVNLSNLVTEIDKNVTISKAYLNALENNPNLAKQLSNPNLKPDEKQKLNQELANVITKSLNVKDTIVKIISTDELGKDNTQILGHNNNGISYVNDKNIKDTKQMVEIVAHETQHDVDKQQNEKTEESYVVNFGKDVSNYVEHAVEYNYDQNLATTNNHNNGIVTQYPSVFNSSNELLNANNQEFAGVNKSAGEDRQLSNDEEVFINNSAIDYSNKIGLSEEKAQELLIIAAKYYNDKGEQQNTPALNEEQIKAGYISTTEYTKAQIDEAYNYLINSSEGLMFVDSYKESMIAQPYFTSTSKQFNDSSWNPSGSVGLEDSSYVFMPMTKVGQTVTKTTTELSPIVIQKTEQLYDNATLGMIQGVYKMTPNMTNKYILDPVNSLKIIGGIDVVNDIFNESSVIPSTVKGTVGSLLNNISNEDEKSIQEKVNYLNKNLDNIKNGILDEK